MKSIHIPASVTSITTGWTNCAFHGCTSLETITVAGGNTVYDSRNNCNAIIETATNTLTHGCRSTVIPNTVTAISSGAFNDITTLHSLTIPNSVHTIGSYAFYGCENLSQLTIGTGIQHVASSAFYGCDRLTATTVLASNAPNGAQEVPGTLIIPCGSRASYEAQVGSSRQLIELTNNAFSAEPANWNMGRVEISTRPSCSDSTAVVLAVPNRGFGFLRWSDGSTDNPHTLQVGDTTTLLLAHFYEKASYDDTLYFYDTLLVRDTVIVDHYTVDTVYFNHYTHDTTYLHHYVHDTLYLTRYVYDTAFINNYIHDTLYLNHFVHDTFYVNNYIHDTLYLTRYIHDTTFVNNYVHDTTYLNRYIHDTTFVNNYIHDTLYLTQYVRDTVFVNNYIHDTLHLTHYVHDTTFVNNYIHDTVYLTQYIYDSGAVQDSLLQRLTAYIDSLMHDSSYVNDMMLDTLFRYIDSHLPDTVVKTDTLVVYETLYVHDTIYIHDTVYVTEEGIEDIQTSNIRLYQRGGQVVAEGCEGCPLMLYDGIGRLLAERRETDGPVVFDVPASGVYLVRFGNAAARRIVVVK